MLMTTGRVSSCGCVEISDGSLPEGTTVTILAAEAGETFKLDPDDEARLRRAIAEALNRDIEKPAGETIKCGDSSAIHAHHIARQ